MCPHGSVGVSGEQSPDSTRKTNEKEKYFRFSVPEKSVLFAGSRYLEVPQRTCRDLVQQFANHGFSFLVGCADGVDRSFRRALANSPYKDSCFVACAFPSRVKHSYSYGLFTSVVVPQNLPPKATLHRRTLWLVRRCSGKKPCNSFVAVKSFSCESLFRLITFSQLKKS